MSDGISWAWDRLKEKEEYQKHIKSKKFNKDYLESDIVRTHSKEEIRLLVVRLIIHNLGGWTKFLNEEFSDAFYSLFEKLSKKSQKDFITSKILDLGLEVGPKIKMDKVREKFKEIENIMHPRSEE